MNSAEVKNLITSDNPIILDIGCHIGKDSVIMANSIPNSTIYSFEADPEVCNRFKQYVFIDNSSDITNNINLVETALSDEIGVVTFNRSSQFKSGTLQTPTGHLQMHRGVAFEKISVPCTTLDDWYSKNLSGRIIDFIWSDVNGGEGKLIKGGLHTLTNYVKYIQLECISRELWEGQVYQSDILNILTNFETIQYDNHDILLKNKNF